MMAYRGPRERKRAWCCFSYRAVINYKRFHANCKHQNTINNDARRRYRLALIARLRTFLVFEFPRCHPRSFRMKNIAPRGRLGTLKLIMYLTKHIICIVTILTSLCLLNNVSIFFRNICRRCTL